MIDISVIICTRNRGSRLRAALQRWQCISGPPSWEMIVSDNGSTDNTAQVVSEMGTSFTVPFLAVYEPIPGTGRAKNAGLMKACGNIALFTDDDCYPEANLLQAVQECFHDPSVGFCGGRVLLYDPTDYRYTIQESTTHRLFEPGIFLAAGLIHGANMAFRREPFQAIGGFDNELGPGTGFVCEEVEAMARMLDAGWCGVYDPKQVIYHHHGRKTEQEIATLRRVYDVGRGVYYTKALLNARMRRVYARAWFRSMRREPVETSMLEILGGLRYLWRHNWRRIN